jgi:hypothetical protein
MKEQPYDINLSIKLWSAIISSGILIIIGFLVAYLILKLPLDKFSENIIEPLIRKCLAK